ncbi:hypothetical protein [Lysinibacillus sp. FJAT-14222]|uniref:hypothetical protein n=1 Tax=Lysinibacillus sp. FJAT-14222 TaxID=1932366 RepID=UPI0006ADAED6|nr:hypothetical protein [Lysinibacillus sp. FJAT-14222]KOS63335.1 hypothetical protein AN161_08955 [Lysinibacillus sp. FJAT-14222]
MKPWSASVAAHPTPPGSFALCESEATATMFYLCESEATATMFLSVRKQQSAWLERKSTPRYSPNFKI